MTSDSAYERIVQGSIIVFLGNVLGMGLAFATRVFPARHLPPSEYGLLALGITLLSTLALVGVLGLYEGIAQRIPRTEEQAEEFTAGLMLSAALSISIGITITAYAGPIAALLVGPAFEPVLQVIGLGIPMMVLSRVVLGGFRGREDVIGRVLVQNILMRGSIFLLVVAMVLLGSGAPGAAVGWAVGLSFTALGGLWLLHRRQRLVTRPRRWLEVVHLKSKPLLKFSLPLMGAASIWQILQETDNLFLAVFRTSADLGVYDASFTMGRLIFLFFWPVGFLIVPVFSGLDERRSRLEIARLYSLTTKWLVFLTLPTALMLVWYPDFVLELMFSSNYSRGADALVILVAAFFFHILTGESRQTLTALGHADVILKGVLFAFGVNLLLNLVLIPEFGIIGAAIASGSAYILLNAGFAFYLFSTYRIHPLSRGMFLALAEGVGIFSVMDWVVGGAVTSSGLYLLSAIGIFYAVFFTTFIHTGGLQDEDVQFYRNVVNRFKN